jgi:dipeptidyl aminopeptidase/acylaminoacyl peptidase
MFFPRHIPFNFQMLRLANHIATGGAELNQLIRVAQEIPEPSADGWYASWTAIGKQELGRAEEAAQQGHFESARDYWLRASNYLRVSTFYMGSEHSEKLASNRDSRAAFAAAQPYMDHGVSNVEVKWHDGATLPGYFLERRDSRPGPVIVFIGGADASKEELYFTGGRRLVDRGYSVLLLDGPGQGEAWLDRGLRAAADWDKLGAPLFDVLSHCPNVDLNRVGLLGISMGGYYAPKIASAEPRFKCLAVWGACFDVLEDLYNFYPAIQRHLRDIAGTDEAHIRDFYSEFNLHEASRHIQCPVLITHGDQDRVVSADSAEKFAKAMGQRGELRMYQGGSHCTYNMPTVAQPPMFDWLDHHLGSHS